MSRHADSCHPCWDRTQASLLMPFRLKDSGRDLRSRYCDGINRSRNLQSRFLWVPVNKRCNLDQDSAHFESPALYVIPFFDILEQILRVFVEYLADDVARVACLLNGGTDVLGQAAVFAEVIGRFTIYHLCSVSDPSDSSGSRNTMHGNLERP